MKVLFDLAHIYYLPQYLPIYKELTQRGIVCEFIFYGNQTILEDRNTSLEAKIHFVKNESEAELIYLSQNPKDWIIFGNRFHRLKRIKGKIRTAFVNHGAGVKVAGYNKDVNTMDVRFVEGSHHLETLSKLYPQNCYVLTGFSKLDPLINQQIQLPQLSSFNLDPNKQTILYAPTFYPSSIELMKESLPSDLRNYNLLIKLHPFSYSKRKYRQQLQRAKSWAKASNTHLVPESETSILPYLGLADLLVSEASTTLFEFSALNKPVVWCDFLKLRWNYRGFFSYRFKQRMDPRMSQYEDIAAHAKNYIHFLEVVKQQLEKPKMFQKQRLAYSERLLGPLDGKASQRVVDYLLNH